MKKKNAAINGMYDKDLINEICNSPLRASVIVSGSVLDKLLEILLKKHFVENTGEIKDLDMFGNQSPLGTFSSKISLAYCLGLISKQLYDDLEKYRKIRNKFAHELVVDTSILQSLEDTCKTFNLLNKAFPGSDKNDVKIKILLEFMVLYVAFIKKINRTENVSICEYEINNLGFDTTDYEFMKGFMM